MRVAIVATAIVTAAATATVAPGCYHPSAASGVPCALDGQCPAGQTCDLAQSPPTCITGDAATVVDSTFDAAPTCATGTSCPASTPICDRPTQVCRGCLADSECPGACLEFLGQCVEETATIYVSPPPAGSDIGTCTMTQPCATFGFALLRLTDARRTIRVGDGSYASIGTPSLHVANTSAGRVVISGERASASGASLAASTDGVTNPAVVQTDSGTNVVIEGLTVHNGGQDGIRSNGPLILYRVDIEANAGSGLNAFNQIGGGLHVRDSRIANNTSTGITVSGQSAGVEVVRSVVLRNAGGGLFIQRASSTIVSSMIVHNGSPTSSFGGVKLQNLNGLPQVLQFDTIADNQCTSTNVAGVQADNNGAVAIDDSILAGNNLDTSPQICATCAAAFSLFVGTPPVGSFRGAPGFIAPASSDYHLLPLSAARSAADPAATVRDDVDGEPRPQGAFDIGADEIP